MNILNSNLMFLKKHVNSIYKTVINDKPLYPLIIYPEHITQQNCKVSNGEKSCFVHSTFNIHNEISWLCDGIKEDVECIILFGNGFGHAINYIKTKFDKLKQLIIVEPSLQIFKEFLNYSDLQELTKEIKFNLTFIVNKNIEETDKIISSHLVNYSNLDMVASISYKTVFNEYYNLVYQNVLKNIRIKNHNLASIYAFRQVWVVNTLRNLKVESLSVTTISEYFKDKPVIIVSAGPSLTKHIGLIEKAKDCAIVIAVGSSIKILNEHGITPHFRVAIDGRKGESTLFQQLKNDNIPLIYGSTLYFDIVSNYSGPKFRMLLKSDLLGKYIDEKSGGKDYCVRTAASVADTAVDLVCKLGCKKVIFIGQDMCFQNGELYAEAKSHSVQISDVDENLYIATTDIYGNKVYTISQYLNIKYALEAVIQKYDDIEFINATEGGLGIDKVKNKSFEEVLEEDLKERVDVSLNTILELFRHRDRNLELLDKTLTKIENEITKMQSVFKKQLKLLESIDLKSTMENDCKEVLIKLNEIAKLDIKYDNYLLYRNVVQILIDQSMVSIEAKYDYSRGDIISQTEAFYKIITARISERQEMLLLINELIQEYKNNQYRVITEF